MTLLDVLLNASPALTTMTTNLTTTMTTSADEHGNVNSTGATTMLSYTSTILGNIDVPKQVIIVNDTISYVESMNDEELNKLENMLLEKEFEFETLEKQSSEELPKVYIKTNN